MNLSECTLIKEREEIKSILTHIACELNISPVELLEQADRTVLMELMGKLQARKKVPGETRDEEIERKLKELENQ